MHNIVSLYRALILSVFKSLLTQFMERESLNYIFIVNKSCSISLKFFMNSLASFTF